MKIKKIRPMTCSKKKKLKNNTLYFLIALMLPSQLISQNYCNPPLTINAGFNTTISCNDSVEIGETPPPPIEDPIAPACSNPSQLTQGGGVYINDVTTTGGINGNDISNLGTLIGGIDPMGPNAWQSVWYSDYTTHTVESTAGNTFYVSINGRSLYNNPPYSFRIWIDWNNDGVFDNIAGSELVYTSPLSTANPISLTNIPINVPSGQQSGVFRMRIRAKDNAPFVDSDNACTYHNPQGITAPYAGYTGSQTGSYWFSSEIEDYGVKITGNSVSGDYTYSWSPTSGVDNPDSPNPTVSPTETTVYTVTVTDIANNCITTDQVTVTVENIEPTFNPVNPICIGASLSPLPTTSTNGITGTWSPALNNTQTTTYTFTPDAGQCGTITTLEIQVESQIIPTFDPVNPICIGASLSPLPTTSNNGISGTWSPALNNTQTTTYTFTPDPDQCGTTTTLEIQVESQIIPTFDPVNPICIGTLLSPLPTTSNNGISGTWSPALNNIQTTTYTFTPDAGQCGTTSTLEIQVESQIIPTFDLVNPICIGTSLSPLPTTSNNGISGTWSPALNNTQTTTYTFTPDPDQCGTTTTLEIQVESQIIPTFDPVNPICIGASLSPLPTTSNNGISGTWSPALNNTQTTTYTFTPTNSDCSIATTMTIEVYPNLNFTVSDVNSICSGESSPSIDIIVENGTPPFTVHYSLNDGEILSTTFTTHSGTITLQNYPGFSNITPNCYDLYVSIESIGFCPTENLVFNDLFCVFPKPNASFVFDQQNNTITVTNTSSDATQYEWNFGDNSTIVYTENAVHQFSSEQEENYTITLIASNNYGCSDTTYKEVSIKDEIAIYVPNAFTPDGDIYNNDFFPVISEGYDPYNYEMRIFNRWGELIFVSNNLKVGWNGTYNGSIAGDGVYIWEIEFNVLNSGEQKKYIGHVNLIR